MVTRFCPLKIHSCLRNRNFLNHLKAVKMEIKISCQNSSHHRVCSVSSKSAPQCDRACLSSMPKCCAPPFRAVVCSTGRTLAPFRNSTFGREKPGWDSGLCEHWERVWDLVSKLGSTSDVKPSPSSNSGWSKHPENSLLQLCKLCSPKCSTPTALHGYSIATVSLAIFRRK